MNHIYTIGYSGSTQDDLARYVAHLDAVLLDVRYSPRSRNPDFSRKRLLERLAGRYMHLKALGNENYRGGPLKLHDPQAAVPVVQDVLAQHSAVILMCGCRDVRDCHRLDAAEYLAQALGGGQIVHLPSRFEEHEVREQLRLPM